VNSPSRFERALQWTFFLVWFFSAGLWYHYADTRPDVPIPEKGNTYLLNTHGSHAYLTYRDCIWLYGSMAVGLGGSVAIISVNLWRRGWTA
jgi:hypothetical protein